MIMGALLIERLNPTRKFRRTMHHRLEGRNRRWLGRWSNFARALPSALRDTSFFNMLEFVVMRSFNFGDSRMRMHQSFPAINLNLAILARRLRPQLTIIDGFEVIAGDGPLHGHSVAMGFALAGTDPIAVDATAARLMGVDPNDIGYLWYAAQGGLGRLDQSEIQLSGTPSITPYVRELPRHTTYHEQLKWRSADALAIFERLKATKTMVTQHASKQPVAVSWD